MDETSITLVVPTLNSAQTLDSTLLSLESQKKANMEVVVVDSGSTDGTHEICSRRGIETAYAEPGNMYRGINAGLKRSRSMWLAYLNSDDWLYPDSLARLIEYGASTSADVAYGDCDYVDEQGRFIYSFAAADPEQLLPLFKLGRMGLAQPAAIFRRELYLKLSGFDESYSFKADADFYIRALKSGAKFARLDGPPVACFRVHASQLSNRRREAIEAEGKRLFESEEMRAGLSDLLTLLRWRCDNLPHYLIRILRESILSRKLRFPKAIERYTHR